MSAKLANPACIASRSLRSRISAAQSVPRERRVDKERPDLGRLPGRIEPRLVTFGRLSLPNRVRRRLQPPQASSYAALRSSATK